MPDIQPVNKRPPDAEEPARELETLRERLIRARENRGLCPDLTELQHDELPGEEPRPGHEERAHHLERCDVCQAHLLEWRNSWEGKAAQLVAWAKVGGKKIGEATERATKKDAPSPELQATFPDPGPISPTSPPAPAFPPVPPEPAPPVAPPKPTPTPPVFQAPPATPAVAASPAPVEVPAPAPLPPRRAPAPPRRRKEKSNEPLPPLIVLESTLAGVVPAALVHAAIERGAAVVTVDNVDEALRDPDFNLVRTIVLTRSRPLAEWQGVMESVRRRAPGRIVIAVMPSPRFGPAAVTWQRDAGVLVPPVADGEWAAALSRLGWPVAA